MKYKAIDNIAIFDLVNEHSRKDVEAKLNRKGIKLSDISIN